MAKKRQETKNIIKKYIRNLQSLGISVQKTILFGSRAKGKFREDSDIDIAVISKEFEIMGLWEKAKYLGRAARGISSPIEALGFSPSQLRKHDQGTMLHEILNSGLEIKF